LNGFGSTPNDLPPVAPPPPPPPPAAPPPLPPTVPMHDCGGGAGEVGGGGGVGSGGGFCSRNCRGLRNSSLVSSDKAESKYPDSSSFFINSSSLFCEASGLLNSPPSIAFSIASLYSY